MTSDLPMTRCDRDATFVPMMNSTPVPVKETQTEHRLKAESLWVVILYNDDDHTYDYVVHMLVTLFGMTTSRAFAHACEVDADGVTIVASLPKEEAIQKRDEILSFGGDPLLGTSVSMNASAEPMSG